MMSGIIRWINLQLLPVKCYFRHLKRWFSYYSICAKLLDFDYHSILYVEKHQLKKVRDCTNHYKSYLDYKRDVDRMNVMLKLIDMMDESWWDGCKYIGPYINIKNKNRFVRVNIIDEEVLKTLLREEKIWNLYNEMHKNYLR